MKCNNCGQTNAPGRLQCEHCNAPLKGSVIASLSDRKGKGNLDGLKCANCGTLNEEGSLKCGHCNAPLKGTMVENSGAKTMTKPMERPTTPKMETSVHNCPNCGYPNLKNAAACIRCATPLAPIITKPMEVETPKARKLGPLPSSTINPWSAPTAPVAKFSLKPLPRKDEKAPVILGFEGDKTELTRENLEPSNRTITTKAQAWVEHRDGGWHLTDQSAQKSTFLLVRGPVKLQKGDVILMGDRMFEFDC